MNFFSILAFSLKFSQLYSVFKSSTGLTCFLGIPGKPWCCSLLLTGRSRNWHRTLEAWFCQLTLSSCLLPLYVYSTWVFSPDIWSVWIKLVLLVSVQLFCMPDFFHVLLYFNDSVVLTYELGCFKEY